MTHKAGLYLHVPFCRRRCPFCDFAISARLQDTAAWVEAVATELDLRAASWADHEFDTVYFGGGTPSLVPPRLIAGLIAHAHTRLAIEDGAEVTLEANPGDVDLGALRELRSSGVDRFSLGVQSFDDDDLEFLGREHTAADSIRSFRDARDAGFENITIDLIYGLPDRSPEHLETQIEATARLAPEHVSAYALTFEPRTPLTRKKERGEVRELTDREARRAFLVARESLGRAGYTSYEVSSFAREPRFESRHNKKYWEGAPYVGVGPSAHSYRDPERFWNVPWLRDYLASLSKRELPTAGSETLGAEEKRLERLFLGLRTRLGVHLTDFEREFGDSLYDTHGATLERLLAKGLATRDNERLVLTSEGFAVADAISVELSSA